MELLLMSLSYARALINALLQDNGPNAALFGTGSIRSEIWVDGYKKDIFTSLWMGENVHYQIRGYSKSMLILCK